MEPLSIFDNPHNMQLLVSAMLGALVGLERELAGKDPSLRTFSLICLGSCMFSLVSETVGSQKTMTDPGRIAAQIVVGIGFLGAGTIFRSRRGITGLTTAALMWVTAAIGMAVGFGHTNDAISATIIALAITVTLSKFHRVIELVRGKNGVQEEEAQSQ